MQRCVCDGCIYEVNYDSPAYLCAIHWHMWIRSSLGNSDECLRKLLAGENVPLRRDDRDFIKTLQPREVPMHRTLIRVVKVVPQDDIFTIVVPAMDTEQEITLKISAVPDYLQMKLCENFRCFAVTNLGAEPGETPVFHSWEAR